MRKRRRRAVSCLALALLLYAVSFAKKLFEFVEKLFVLEETDTILKMLSLIDAALVASLVVMVIISGYENFVSRFDNAEGTEISWLGKVDASSLKIKVASTIVAISSIHLLKTFINAANYDEKTLMWQTVIHVAFLASALFLVHPMQVEGVTLDELLTQSDYITVHMPMTDDTKHMIDEAALAKCKKGIRLFNCARGGIIKEAALIAGLKSGHVAAAGLDVFEDEPLAKDSELRSLANVTLTPHLGASTAEAQESVGIEIAEQIADVLNGGVIRNAVNMPTMDANAVKVLGPYIDLGTKLGTLVQQIAPAQIATLRITYWGKIVDLDVNAVTRAIERGFLRRISGDSINFVNAPSALERLGVRAEVVKSTDDSGYTDLIKVEAVAGDLFKEWERELREISDPTMRNDSRRKLEDSRAKYNQLLRIEEILGPAAQYGGTI